MNKWFSDDSGALWNTEKPDWTHGKPVRYNYARTYCNIENVRQCKATIRAGEFAWPGGYQTAFITSDGALICFDCARRNFRSIAQSIKRKANDGWRIVACDIVEDMEYDIDCDNCNKLLCEGTENEN